MKNLKTLNDSELKNFFNSIDRIICDVDGVIWKGFVAIPGAAACIDSLKSINKDVRLATNFVNATQSRYQELLTLNKINMEVKDVITPLHVIVKYLTEHKFNKKLFVIGHEPFKVEFENAGFTVAKDRVYEVESDDDFLKNIADDLEIGAVVCDFDINMNLVTLQKVLTCLQREECLFIAGAADKLAPLREDLFLFYNYHYLEILKEFSGREYKQFAKPSSHFKDFLIKKFNITQPNRTLFIGDSVAEDIKFAKSCGFKTLLALSGVTKAEHLENWPYAEEDKPDYYIDSLDVLNSVLINSFSSLKK